MRLSAKLIALVVAATTIIDAGANEIPCFVRHAKGRVDLPSAYLIPIEHITPNAGAVVNRIEQAVVRLGDGATLFLETTPPDGSSIAPRSAAIADLDEPLRNRLEATLKSFKALPPAGIIDAMPLRDLRLDLAAALVEARCMKLVHPHGVQTVETLATQMAQRRALQIHYLESNEQARRAIEIGSNAEAAAEIIVTARSCRPWDRAMQGFLDDLARGASIKRSQDAITRRARAFGSKLQDRPAWQARMLRIESTIFDVLDSGDKVVIVTGALHMPDLTERKGESWARCSRREP